MKKDCIFCNLKREKIFEDKYFYSVFDIHPVSPGHALIIPKRHVISLLDLNSKEWNALNNNIKKTILIIEKTNFINLYKKLYSDKLSKRSPSFCKKMLKHKGIKKRPQGYNIGNNEGEVAGRTINHLHVQIIPRYKGDVKDPTGGIRTIIPKLGNYKK
jgi:diadenosine tetraphosphate (Ap4A) HIT family hydrolase